MTNMIELLVLQRDLRQTGSYFQYCNHLKAYKCFQIGVADLLTNYNNQLANKHSIPKRIKAIMFLNRDFIGMQDLFPTGKSTDQHD